MSKLDSHQIDQALRQTPGWRRSGDTITRTFSLPSFPAALLFAAAVGHLAERAEHHPDMLIQYRSVTLTLSDPQRRGADRPGFCSGCRGQRDRAISNFRLVISAEAGIEARAAGHPPPWV